ncbi:MAG: OsmC family protein [Gaiellaceae bacterium]
MANRARELRFAVDLAPSGELREENGSALALPAEWTPEHLLLAALIRCSLASLGYHAERAGLEIARASGSTRALVTKRESDGRYAVVESDVELAVEIESEPGADELVELLAKAERDCFVGASLNEKPRYSWTVNGRPAGA